MALGLPDRTGAGLIGGAGVGLVLVAYGNAEHPQASFLSLAAALSILVSYGALGLALMNTRSQRRALIARTARVAGISAGAVYAAEILLEYAYLPRDNTQLGYVEFGTVFLIYGLAAARIALATRSIPDAVRTAFVAALISTLIWCLVLLTVFYLFEGTTAQALVLAAEGEPQDFVRSGMSDYGRFLIEDLFGATFFHLLLGPALAAFLGLLTGLAVQTVLPSEDHEG